MNPLHDVSSIDGDTSIQQRSMLSALVGGGAGHASIGGHAQQQDLDTISISGELWFVADGNKPNRSSAAGRGSKQRIVIENSRLEIFSSSSDQARMVKGFTMRNIRRTSWFVHDPQPAGLKLQEQTASAVQRGGRGKATIASAIGRTHSAPGASKAPPAAAATKYYYIVVEAAVDALQVPHGHLASGPRNDRIVFCTDHQEDFQIWMQFFDQVGPGITLDDYFDGRSVSVMSAADSLQSRSATPPPAGGSVFAPPPHDDFLAHQHQFKSEVEKLSSFAAEWKMKAMDLFQTVQSTIASFPTSTADEERHHSHHTSSPLRMPPQLSVAALTDDWHTYSSSLVSQLRSVLVPVAGQLLHHESAPLSLQDTRAFRSESLPPTAAILDADVVDNKVHHLQKLVHHYIRTETSACDVINDFERRNRALMGAPLSGDTPSKLRAVYAHLTRKLSAAWVTISSQPRSTSSGGASLSPFVSRSHSAETNTTAQHRKTAAAAAMYFSDDSFTLVPPTPESYAAAATALSVSTEDLMNLVVFVRSQIAKAEEAGHVIVPRDAHPLAQQLDVIMQQLSSVDAATVRVETERVLATRTEYLLSEIARLRSILDEKERRLAEEQVRAGRLEELVRSASGSSKSPPRAAAARFGGASSSPLRSGITADALANASLRDTERTIAELLKSLEHHGVQLPSGSSSAVKLRFAFENLFFNTTPLIHQVISPEEAHGMKQLIDHKSHTIQRLERQLLEAQAIQDQIHKQHHKEMSAAAAAAYHHMDGNDKPAVTLHALTPAASADAVGGDNSNTAAAAAAARKVADIATVLRQREEQIEIMKRDLQSVKDLDAATTANKAELEHWKSRCAKLERDAALAHISSDAAAEQLLPSPVLSAASSQAVVSRQAQQQPSEERFVQLLTVKNRQIASLQAHITSLLAAQPLPQDNDFHYAGGAQASALQLPAPTVVQARSSSLTFQDTEQAALGLLEEAESDFSLLLPEGSTAARLRYVFDTLNRQLSEALQQNEISLGGGVSESTQRSNQANPNASSVHADALAQSVLQLSVAMGEPLDMLPPRPPSSSSDDMGGAGSASSPNRHQEAFTKALGAVVQRATEFIKSGAFDDDESSPHVADDMTSSATDRAPLAASAIELAPRRSSLGQPRRVAAKAKPQSATSGGSPLQAPLSLPKVSDATKAALELDSIAQQLRALLQRHSSHRELHAASLVSHGASIHESIHGIEQLITRLETTAHDERRAAQMKQAAIQEQLEEQRQADLQQQKQQLLQQFHQQQQVERQQWTSPQTSADVPHSSAVDPRELSALEHSAIDAITDILANENLLTDAVTDAAAPPQQLRDGVLRLLKQADELKDELRRAHSTESDVRRDLVNARGEISRQALLVTEAETQRDDHMSSLRTSQRLLARFVDDVAEAVTSQKKAFGSQFAEFHRSLLFMHHEGVRDALAGAMATSRKSIAAAQSLDGRVQELEQHLSAVSLELQQSQSASRDLRATIEDVTNARDDLRAKTIELTAQLRDTVEDTDQQLAELEQKLDRQQDVEDNLRKDIQRLTANVEQLTAALKDEEQSTDRKVEQSRKAQLSSQSVVDELTQELLDTRQTRDRDISALKLANELSRRQWEQETEALRTRIDAMQDAAADGREGVTVLCLLGDPHEAPATAAVVGKEGPSTLDTFEAFKEDERLLSSSSRLGASFGAITTSSLGSSTAHSFVKRRGSVAPAAPASPLGGAVSGATIDAEDELVAKTEDVLAMVQQLAGVKGSGKDQRLTTSLARLKAFTNWCYDRLVPFAFGSNTQCQTVLDSLVWAAEGHMRLLRHSAPLLSAAHLDSQGQNSTSSEMTISEKVAWRMRELSEEHDALRAAIQSAADMAVTVPLTSTSSSGSNSPTAAPSARRKSTASIGNAAPSSSTVKDNMSNIASVVTAVARMMETFNVPSFVDLELLVVKHSRSAHQHDALLSTLRRIPVLIPSPLLGSEEDIVHPLRSVTAETAPDVLVATMEHIGAVLREVENSLVLLAAAPSTADSPSKKSTQSAKVLPLPVMSPDALRLSLAAIPHLQAELEASRKDLRVALASMADRHATQMEDSEQSKMLLQGTVDDLRQRLQVEIDERAAVESECRRQRGDLDILEESIQQSNQQYEVNALRIQELELQLRRLDFDTVESLKVLGALQGAHVDGAELQRPSMISVATSAAERIKELEAVIVEAGWAIRPSVIGNGGRSASLSSSVNNLQGTLYGAPRRSFLAGASTSASGTSPERYVFPTEPPAVQPPARQATPQRSASTVRASLLSPLVTVVSDDDDFTPDAHNSPSPSHAGGVASILAAAATAPTAAASSPQSLVQLCRSTAAENQQLRTDRDGLGRDLAALRTAVEDVAYHLRVQCDELRSTDTSTFLTAAVPKVVSAAQDARHTCDAALQDIKHTSSSLQGTSVKLAHSEQALQDVQDELARTQQAAADADRDWQNRFRDMKKDLDDARRFGEEVRDALDALRSESAAEIASLQQRCIELQIARQSLSDELGRVSDVSTEAVDGLQATLRDLATQRDAMQRKLDVLSRDQQEALALPSAVQHSVRSSAQLGQLFDQLVTSGDRGTIESSEVAARRQLELRWQQEQHSFVAQCAFDALRSVAIIVSIVGAPSTDSVADVVRALHQSEAALRVMCGDPSVGRKESVTRSDCIAAIRQVLPLLHHHSSSAAPSHQFDESSNPAPTGGPSIVQLLLDGCHTLSQEYETTHNTLVNTTADVKALRDELRRLRAGADDAEAQQSNTQHDLAATQLQLSEQTQRRSFELRFVESLLAAVASFTTVATHQAASASSLLPQPCAMDQITASVDALLQSDAAARSLLGPSNAIAAMPRLKSDHTTRVQLLLAMHDAIHVISDGRHASSYLAIPTDESIPVGDVLLEFVRIARDDSEDTHEQLIATTRALERALSELRDTENRLGSASGDVDDLTFALASAMLSLEEVNARRALEQRQCDTIPIQQHVIAAAHACIVACNTSGEPSLGVGGLVSFVQETVANATGYLSLVGDPTCARRDLATRSSLIAATREAIYLLEGTDSELDICSALLAATRAAAQELRESREHLHVLVPEAHRAQEDVKYLTATLKSVQQSYESHEHNSDAAALQQQETVERQTIEGRYWESLDIAFLRDAAVVGWQAASLAGVSLYEAPQELRQLVASEMKLRALAGDLQLTRDTPTEVTRSSCIAAIMQAIHVLGADIKGDLLSSLLTACAQAARTVDDAHTALPALSGELRKLKEDHRALQQQFAALQEDSWYVKTKRDQLLLQLHELQGRRHLEVQAQANAWESLVPVATMCMSHALEAASVFGDKVPVTSLLAQAVGSLARERAYLATLAGDVSVLPTDGSRSEHLDAMFECLDVLEHDIPRQNIATALVSACRSSHRQTQGDAIALQTITAELKRTQEELSIYAVQTLTAKEHSHSTSAIVLMQQLAMDELSERAELQLQWALEPPQPHVAELVDTHHAAMITASALGVSLAGLSREVHRIADEHVIFSAMVGEQDVGAQMGSRSELAQTVLRTIEILRAAAGVTSQRASAGSRRQMSPSREDSVALTSVAHDVADALALARARARSAENHLLMISDDAQALLDGVAQSCMLLREDKRKLVVQHHSATELPMHQLSFGTPSRSSKLQQHAADTPPYSAIRELVGDERDVYFAGLPSPRDVALNQSFGSAALDRSIDAAVDESRVAHLHRRLVNAAADVDRAAREAVTKSSGLSAILQSACEVLRRSRQRQGGPSSDDPHQSSRTTEAFDILDLVALCQHITQELDVLRDDHVLVSADLSDSKDKARRLLSIVTHSMAQLRRVLRQCNVSVDDETDMIAHDSDESTSDVADAVSVTVDRVCTALKSTHDQVTIVKNIANTATVLHAQYLPAGALPPPSASSDTDTNNADVVRHVEALLRSLENTVRLLEQERKQSAELLERLHDTEVASETNRALLEGQADSLNNDLIRKMDVVQTLLRRLEASNYRVSQLEGAVVEVAHACRLSTTLAPPLSDTSTDMGGGELSETTATEDDEAHHSSNAIECARRAADAASNALRANDVLISEQRSLKQQLAHSTERCAHAEREVALMHERLDQSSAQFTALQQEDALRARELRTLNDQLANAKEDARRVERDLLDQQEQRVAEVQRRLDDAMHSAAAAQSHAIATTKAHDEEITNLKDTIVSLQESCVDLQQTGNTYLAQLRRLYVRMRSDSVEGCVKYVDELHYKCLLLDVQLDEAVRRQRHIASLASGVPSSMSTLAITAIHTAMELGSLLQAKDMTDAADKLRAVLASKEELLQLSGDVTVGRSIASTTVTRSEAIIAMLHALSILHDDNLSGSSNVADQFDPSPSPRMSPSRIARRNSSFSGATAVPEAISSMSLTEQLVSNVTDTVERLAHARRAAALGRSDAHDIADKLSTTVNVIVASLGSLRRAVDPTRDPGAPAGGSTVHLVASLDVAVRDACDHIEQMRDTLGSAAASLASLRLVGGGGDAASTRRRSSPQRVTMSSLSDVTAVAQSVRLCVDELLTLRQHRRDLDSKLERSQADKSVLLKSVVSSLATLPRLATMHRTTSVVGGALAKSSTAAPVAFLVSAASVSAPSSANSSVVFGGNNNDDDDNNTFGKFNVSVGNNDDSHISGAAQPTRHEDPHADDGVEPISAARQLEVCTQTMQAAARNAAKVASEAVAILREHVDHESFIAVDAACQAGTERRPLLIALVETTAELYRQLRDDMQQQSAILKRAETRSEQLRAELVANEERHLAQLQEQEEERFGEVHRVSGALDKAKEAAATQRARAELFDRTLREAAAAMLVEHGDTSDELSAFVERAAEIRASLDALRSQHKALNHTHNALIDNAKTLERDLQETQSAYQQLQEESQAFRRTTIAELQQERSDRANVELQLASEARSTAALTSANTELSEELQKLKIDHQDHISRIHEVQQAEIELLHGQVRDRDEHLLHIDGVAQDTSRELRVLQFRHDSHLSMMQASSLEEIAQGAREQRHEAELLALELQCAEERERMLQRCATELGNACAGWVTSTAAAFALSASLLGEDTTVASAVPVLESLLEQQRDLLTLLGADSAATILKHHNSITVPRSNILESVLASIRELTEALEHDVDTSVTAIGSSSARQDVHIWLEEIAHTCARDLIEARASLAARSEDLRKLFEEHQHMASAIRGALADIKQSKKWIPTPQGQQHTPSSLQGSPDKQQHGADDSSVLSLATIDAAATVTWRELPGEARELADASARAHQMLIQAASHIVPVALLHLRNASAPLDVAASSSDGHHSSVVLVDNLTLACHRAAGELISLREEKAAARHECDQLRSIVEGYIASVRPTVRSMFQACPPQGGAALHHNNESFLVAVPDAGITSTDTIDISTISSAEHAALCEELRESTQRLISDVKKSRRWVRESLDMLNPVLASPELSLHDVSQDTDATTPRILPECASLAAESIVQLRHDGEALRAALRKTEAKLDAVKADLRDSGSASESQAARHEAQLADVESSHRDAVERLKSSIADLQREVAALKRAVSDVTHAIDLDDDWDSPVELFQRMQTRVETLVKQLEQSQQTCKHQASEIKHLKTKENDLVANRAILENQLEQLNGELEETQRLNATRSREHRKELELLQHSVEDLQHALHEATDEVASKLTTIDRLHQDLQQLRDQHHDELERLTRDAQEADVVAREALDSATQGRIAVTKQHEALLHRVALHNRHLHVDSLDGADAAWAASVIRTAQLELFVEEAQQRHSIEAKSTQCLLAGTEGLVAPVLEPFLYRGHGLAVSTALAVNADFGSMSTMVRTLVATEQHLQSLQGNQQSALKTKATRADLIDAIASVRYYLQMPLEYEHDNVFASGAAAAVGDLVERYANLSAQHNATSASLHSANEALQKLTDSASAAAIILQGPAVHLSVSDSLFALSPISPVGGQPTAMKVTALSAQLERAAQTSADAVRRHKQSVTAALNALSVLWDPVHLAANSSNTSNTSATSMLVTPPRPIMHTHTSTVFGGSDYLESLDIAADRLCREVSSLRTNSELLERERDDLNNKLLVYQSRVPPTVKTLSAAIATNTTTTTPFSTPLPSPAASPARVPRGVGVGGNNSLNTSTDVAPPVLPDVETPTAVCVKLQNQALQVVEEWSRAHKQLQDTIIQLQSIPTVSGRSAVLAAASAVDAAREQDNKLEQRALQIRKLEGRIEALQQDIRNLQDQHEHALLQNVNSAQVAETNLLQMVDKLRGQQADANAAIQVFRTFVGDVAGCLLEDVPQSILSTSLDPTELSGAFQSLLKACSSLRQNFEQAQQQHRRHVSTIESIELELHQARTELRDQVERADMLAAHTHELQRDREASDKKYRFEIEQHTRSAEELERRSAVADRDNSAALSDVKKQLDEAISGTRRITESCGIVSVSPAGRPIPVPELVHLAQRHIESITRDLAESHKQHKALEAEHAKFVSDSRAETSRLLQSLDRVSSECEAKHDKEVTLINELQALVSQYHELLAPSRANDAPMTPVAIVAMCLEQADKRNKLLEIAKRTQLQLETDAAKSASQIGALREELRKAQAERQDLSTQYTALQKSHHASGVESTSVTAELNGVKSQVHKLFDSACKYAQRDLGMTIPSGESNNSTNVSVGSTSTVSTSVDRGVAGEISVVQSILQQVVHRYRNAPTSDELHTIKAEHTNSLAEERNKRSAAERLQAKVEETLLPLILPRSVRHGHASHVDGAVTSSSAPRALLDDITTSALKIKENLLKCAEMLQGHIDVTAGGMKDSDLGTISSLLLDATQTLAQRHTRIISVANFVADKLKTSHIDDATNTSVTEAVRRWGEQVLTAAQQGDVVVHKFAEKLTEHFKLLSVQSAHPLPPSFLYAESAAARDGSSIAHIDATLAGVQDFTRSLVTQFTHLTSEWQQQGDINRRQSLRIEDLVAECGHLRQQVEAHVADQQAFETHINELRRQVRKKLDDDRKSEAQMQLLDERLQQQAAELSLKYRSDRDFIERRFADLRGFTRPRAPSVSSIGSDHGQQLYHHQYQQLQQQPQQQHNSTLASMTTFSRVSSRSNSGAY